MPVREILLLGHPLLRKKCSAVKDIRSKESIGVVADLRDTLKAFRGAHGFGRGIAAPQIGIVKRIVYVDAAGFKGALFNPRIERASVSRALIWDDCFSIPDLIVKVARHRTIELSYVDETGARCRLKARGALAELLQHELDHLDGILAIDRAVNSKHIILRSQAGKHR